MSIIKFEKREYQVITSCEHHQITIDRANKKITCRSCDIELDPFDEITIVRGDVVKGGRIDVELYELNT